MTTRILSAEDAVLVTLDNDMFWVDEFEYNPILIDEEDTVDNGIWHNEALRLDEAGRKITLETIGGLGLQKKSTVSALKALDIVPNTTYKIYIEDDGLIVEKIVRFDHSDDEGGVSFRPAYDTAGLNPSSVWYTGRIKFIVAG